MSYYTIPAYIFELPPRVELGTTDYKSVILPAKLQKLILSYFRQAFYFQLREIVSNLAPLTAVWVPEDVTFCSPYGNRTRLLSVKGICPKPIDEGTIFSFPICQRTLLFCCYLQQRYKITTLFLICQITNKKKPIFFGDGFC